MKKEDIYNNDFHELTTIIVKSVTNSRELLECERDVLDKWLKTSKKNRETYNNINCEDKLKELLDSLDQQFAIRQLAGVKRRIKRRERMKLIKELFTYGSAAAAIFIVVMLFRPIVNEFIDSSYALKERESLDKSKVILVDRDGSSVALEQSVVDFSDIRLENSGLKVGDIKSVQENISSQVSKLEPVENKRVIVPKGREIVVVLPDGSSVWLGANSTLIFPDRFKDNLREVTVEGEAIFTVVKDMSAPFIVKSKFLETTVYGTEFMVKSYANSSLGAVSLLSGVVEVKNIAGDIKRLKPGERASAYEGDDSIITDLINIENIRSVSQGMFVFWGEKISDIIPMLSNWYDYKIECDSKSQEMVFYIRANKGDSLEHIMELLVQTNTIKYKIDKKERSVRIWASEIK